MVPATYALRNARIYPLVSGLECVDSVAWGADRIVACGAWPQVEGACSPATHVIDAHGLTVLPGITDAHLHLDSLGRTVSQPNLSGVRSFEELVLRVVERIRKSKPGEWIVGRGWDHTLWPGRSFPTHEKLSQVSAQNPVWLYRRDGHSGLANAAALARAGINADTPDPPGGEILRAPGSRQPTGILIDGAIQVMERVLPAPTQEQLQRWILEGQEECLRHGLTGVHDAGVTASYLEAAKSLVRQGLLKIRIYGMHYSPDLQAMEEYIRRNSPFQIYGRGNLLSMRALKFYLDGSLGSRSAWMFEPYADRPRDDRGNPYSGLPLVTPQRLASIAELATQKGFQVCVHAIGDRANHEALNALQAALSRSDPGDRRHRIEHAQFVSPSDIERFRVLGVIASMQPSHAVSDRVTVAERFGTADPQGAYAWKSFVKNEVHLASGSDAPFERVSPLWTYFCSVTRQDSTGSPAAGWMPQERLSPLEAVRSMTIEPAYAAFEEKDRGTIAPGKLADLTVLSSDILGEDVRSVLRADVVATVIGGTIAHGHF
jgi:predicted amidohydrolase YtcJ